MAKEKFGHLQLDSDTINETNSKSRPLSHRIQSTNAQSTKSYSVISNTGIMQNQANYLSKLSSPKTKLSSVNSSSIISTYPGKYPNTDSINEKEMKTSSEKEHPSPKSQR